jgi:hypothetical protein
VKADRLRRPCGWASLSAASLSKLVLADEWERLHEELARLVPYSSEVQMSRMTRTLADWKSSYQLVEREAKDGHVV